MSDSETKKETTLDNGNQSKSNMEVLSIEQDSRIESTWTEVIEQFDRMNLYESLLRGIHAHGFERPSTIQQHAIKPCILGHDVIIQTQSGTGKTVTCIISVLQRLDMNIKDCQVLILATTRQRAQEMQKEILSLGTYMNVTCYVCMGGRHVQDDIKRLEGGVQIVIGTPGRVYNMLHQSNLHSQTIKMFVLDEVDELFARGFKDKINDIFTSMPQNIQILFLSATMPVDVLQIVNKFMKNPVQILDKKQLTDERLLQFYVHVKNEEQKLDTLYNLYKTIKPIQAIIFCNTRQTIDWLIENMRGHDVILSPICDDMSEKERDITMKEFRAGSSRILITTDLVVRHIEVQRVGLIINYDLPHKLEYYIHRIGHRGQFGPKGIVISLITDNEQQLLHDIEQFYFTHIKEMPLNVADLI